MARIEGTEKIGVSELGAGRVKALVGLYDFALDGGAVGDITLRGEQLPINAIVVDALLEVDTVLTSAGAPTVAIKTEGAADINAADLISGTPWSTTGAKRTDFTATSAPIKITATRAVIATVAVAALTAGKFKVVIYYVELAD